MKRRSEEFPVFPVTIFVLPSPNLGVFDSVTSRVDAARSASAALELSSLLSVPRALPLSFR